MKLFGGRRPDRTRRPIRERTDEALREEESSYNRRDDISREEPKLERSSSAAQQELPAFCYTRSGRRRKSRKLRRRNTLRAIGITAVVLVCLYLTAVYSNVPFIKRYREVYINAAMETMTHQWLATAFIPAPVINKVMEERSAALIGQIGLQSNDPPVIKPQPTPPDAATENTEEVLSAEQEERQAFYELFWELDEDSMEAYLQDHPDVLDDGYGGIDINEAGLDDDGTDIETTMGEQVLAIDAENQILIVRVSGSTFKGVLCIAKDPSRLALKPSKGIGSYGETVKTISERNNGVLAITGSGFLDPSGNGNGGALAGTCVCDGEIIGDHHMSWGNMRIELHENDWFYITDAPTDIGSDVTDAVEFTPVLIVNGKMVVDETTFYNAMNPRACIGQSDKGEIMMIGIEGRFWDSPGCSVVECAKIFMEHRCLTALNLDGGTSAIVCYKGESIMRCSNTSLPNGRYLPNAWVYSGK